MNMICVYSTVINVMILIYGLCFFLYFFSLFWGLSMPALQMLLKILRRLEFASTAFSWTVLSEFWHIIDKLVHHISQPLYLFKFLLRCNILNREKFELVNLTNDLP